MLSHGDIQTLAEYGARRVMEYLKKGNVDTLSFQELVVFTLMTGEANTRLTQCKVGEQGKLSKGRWNVRGFFAKPVIKVETEKKGQVRQAVYLPALAGTS